MTSRKPTPLKDEKPDPVEELQEQMTELIAAVNSLAEKGVATAECRPDEKFKNVISTAVVKAVQDLLEARQKKSRKPKRTGCYFLTITKSTVNKKSILAETYLQPGYHY